jgi:hypothetical protein
MTDTSTEAVERLVVRLMQARDPAEQLCDAIDAAIRAEAEE